jgi:PEP-CTERM motif
MTRQHIPLLALLLAGASLALPAAHAAEASLAGTPWAGTGAAGLIGATSTVPASPLGNSLFAYVSTADSAAFGVSPLLLKTDGKGNEMANNGSVLVSGSFAAVAGQTLALQFNYVSTDGRGYDDYAWARLIHAGNNSTAAWLYTARSTNSARGNVVPGDVLSRQQDKDLPDELDATLNNGNSVGFDVASTAWQPLGFSTGYCWDGANTCGPSGWIRSDYTFAQTGSFRLEIGVVNWGDQAFDSALAVDYSGLAQGDFPGLTVMAAVPEPGQLAMMLSGLGLMAGMGWRNRRTSQSRIV